MYDDSCGNISQPRMGEFIDFTGPYQAENRWINKLKQAQILKFQDSSSQIYSNITYVNAIEDSIQQTKVVSILKSDSLMAECDWLAAFTELQNVLPQNAVEDFWKEVGLLLTSYLPVFEVSQDTIISATDSVYLYDWANRCPYQWGEAVFKARIFIQRYIYPFEVFADNCSNSSPYVRYGNIESNSTASVAQVYPNPANSEVYIHLANNHSASVILLDMQGRVYAEWKEYGVNTPLDISQLSNGVYLFVIETESGQDVLHWIKQ